MKRKRKRGFFRKLILLLLLILIIFGVRYIYVVKQQVEEVNKWQKTVQATTTELGLSDYQELVLAIILTETKGGHIDIMQSSESKYGETNKIETSEESIYSGVEHLAEVITESEAQGTDLWTAVQAYNFGSNYIAYVQQNGGINTTALAEKYSKDILGPLLGNINGEQYRYLTPRAFKYNRGYLYKDGGNFFYAEIVRWNMQVMHFFDRLPF